MTQRPLAEILRGAPLEPNKAITLALAIADALAERRASAGWFGLEVDSVRVAAADEGWRAQVLSPATIPEEHGSGLALAARTCLAPEALAGADADERADIYALGVILYQALSGRLPFEAASPVDALARKLGGVMPQITEVAPVDAEVAALIADTITVDPAKRLRLTQARQRLMVVRDAMALAPPVAEPVAKPEPEPDTSREPTDNEVEGGFFSAGDELGELDDAHYEPAPTRTRYVVGGVLAAALLVVVVIVANMQGSPPRPSSVASGIEPDVTPPVAARAAPPAAAPLPVVMSPIDAGASVALAPEAASAAPPQLAPARRAARREPLTARAETPQPPPPAVVAPAITDWVAEGDRLRAEGKSTDAYRAYLKASKGGDAAVIARAHLGMAQIALHQRRYSEALDSARRSLELGGDTRRAWTIISIAACALGAAEQAATAHARLGGGSCK
jgi:hypothetical protein